MLPMTITSCIITYTYNTSTSVYVTQLQGVEAVSIHGGKDQEERNEAIRLYKEGKKDVLVATDIAAKGLDFPDIQHVINFDMPGTNFYCCVVRCRS
jgi:superfamily II DNA/RNA helicase